MLLQDSGMSHIAHSVGVPMIIVQNKLEFSRYHAGKKYSLTTDLDSMIRLI